MKLPEQVKIGPYTFKVELHERPLGEQNQELYGDIKFNSQVIRVQTGLTDERTLAIFLHECVHGIDEAMCIGLSEKQTTRLGVGLAAFLRDNGLLNPEL